MNAIKITAETIESFRKYLQDRGCYAESTIGVKLSIARAMGRSLDGKPLPLDEGAATQLIGDLGLQGRRKCEYNTIARDLIASYRWAAPEVRA